MTNRRDIETFPQLEHLRAILAYAPATGVFTWLVPISRKMRPGKVAGSSFGARGYRRIRISGVEYSAHRLAWLHYYGTPPSKWIDHVNGDTSDNRISNLREATPLQNSANSRRGKNNTSGLKGVSFRARRGTWRASIMVDGRTIWLGSFRTAKEAGDAYASAAKEYFGEFARVA